MEGSRNYRDLIVWKRSIDLVGVIYSCTRSFPKEETYGITSQIRRAGVSIPVNIAEGQARNSKGEFRQFLGIAQGSLAELETLLTISGNLAYLTSRDVGRLLNDGGALAMGRREDGRGSFEFLVFSF